MRRIMIIAGLVTALATVAIPAASAQGVSPAELERASWTCIIPPGDNIHCAPPGGLERVLSAEAETMTFLVFQTGDETFLGTEFIIRADLFNPRPCPTDPPSREYTHLLPLLGLDYWACHRYDSPF